jgi:cystathionine beta-lyase/cystathionine gamma-synthase
MDENFYLDTLAVHAGMVADPATGAVIPPIYQTSTYAQDKVGGHKGYEYSRTDNPTRKALETCLAELEKGQSDQQTFGLAFSSGMAATDTVLRLLKPGDHIIAGNDVYGGTYRLFERVLRPYGLVFDYVDTTDLSRVQSFLRPETRMVWLETPTNPLMKITDIRSVSEVCHSNHREILVCVDNTFASPYLQRPIELGADVVVHSTTKYLGGHSDLVGGAVVTCLSHLYDGLKFLQNAVGAVPGPMDCWLALRGIKTLAVRMERHCKNAMAVAEYLEKHAWVKQVLYPGLSSHSGHEIAAQQMSGFGGMISFILEGGEVSARSFVESTRIFTLAESLGGVESLIEVPAAMTHASVANSPLQVDAGLVRLSVGIESLADLIQDLEQAFEKI